MPPETSSFGFRFGGGSTRLFAVYDLASGILLKLVPQPVYNSQWFVYSEVSEILSGAVVTVSVLESIPPSPGEDFSINDAANG